MKRHSKRYSTIILFFLMLLGSFTIELLAQESTSDNRNVSLPPMTEVPNLDALNKPSTVWDYLPRFITQAFEPKFDDTNSAVPLGEGKPAQEMSILLDGESGYLRVPNSPSLNLSSKFTIEAWVLPAEITTANGIIEKYEKGVGGFSLRLSPRGVLELQVTGADPNALEHAVVGNSIIAKNEWRHVAVTYVDGEMLIYLDGKLDAQITVQSLNLINNADLTIGLTRSQDGKESFFKGTMDEIRISNFARYTENFVPEKYLYGGGIFGQIAGAWRFSDQKTEDTTGNNNHAVISGKAYFVQDPRSGDVEAKTERTQDQELEVSPQAFINFDNVSTGTYLHNVYPDASFYETSGYAMYSAYECLTSGLPCAGQSLPNFARAKNGTQNVVFIFAQPVSLTRFDILAVDEYPGSVTNRLSLRQDGVFYTYNVISSGWNVPLSINVTQLSCGQSACDRVTQVNVHTIFDYLGLGYDNFSYTIYSSPTPNPTPNCLTGSSAEAGMDPCPPQPTPTPNIPNPPTDVALTEDKGKVKITWKSLTTSQRPYAADRFKVYRSDTENGANPEELGVIANSYGVAKSFTDKDIKLRIDTARYYFVTAENQYGTSEPSAIVSGKPLWGCDDSDVIIPPGSGSFASNSWTGNYSFEQGFSVSNVSLSGRLMAVKMGVPSVQLMYFDGEYRHTNVDLDNSEMQDGWLSKLVSFFAAQRKAKYCVSNPSGQETYRIAIEYKFLPEELGDACEPTSGLPCARYYPFVSFVYSSDEEFDLTQEQRKKNLQYFWIRQRFHFREDNNLNNVIAFIQDCDNASFLFEPNSANRCTSAGFPISKAGTVNPLKTEIFDRAIFDTGIAPQEPGFAEVGIDGPIVAYRTGFPDNFHQTSGNSVLLPGPFNNEDWSLAGCPTCVHSHWRWTGSLMRLLPPATLNVRNNPGTFGGRHTVGENYAHPDLRFLGLDYYYLSHPNHLNGRRMSGAASVVKYRPEEENFHTPPANREKIYQDIRMVNGHPLPTRGDDIVLWYRSESLLSNPKLDSGKWIFSETMNAHGGFFQPVRQRDKQLPVERDLTSFVGYPIEVTARNYFRLPTTTAIPKISAELYGSIFVTNIPAGYTYLPSTSYTLSVPEPPRFDNFFTMQQATSGKQIVKYKVVDPNVSLSNLRILHSVTDDEERDVRKWTDATVLSGPNAPDPINRVLSAEVSKLGVFTLATFAPAVVDSRKLQSSADLVITGNTAPDPVPSGNNVTYTFTIVNNGPQSATNVILVQDLDPGTRLISAASSAGFCHLGDGHPLTKAVPEHDSPETNSVFCKVGNLQSGNNAVVTVVASTSIFGDGKQTEPVQVESEVRVSAEETDTNPDNNLIAAIFNLLPSTNTPPLVNFVQPLEGAIFRSVSEDPVTIPVRLTASDPNGTISEVKVYDSGEFLGLAQSIGNGEYSFDFITADTGYHSLTASAKDDGGRTTSTGIVQILVNSRHEIVLTKPVLQLFSPGTTVEIETRSSLSGTRLQKVEVFDNGLLLGKMRSASNTGNIFTHRFTVPNVSRGRHSLTAVLTDIAGETTVSEPVAFTVTMLPSISITSPNDASSFASGSSIDITVQTGDADGYVQELNFYASGKLIGTKSESIVKGSSTFRWINPDDGVYTIVVTATDDTDEIVSSNFVNIGINNPPPAIGEMIWLDDVIPSGATFGGDDGWNWLNTNPAALIGANAHQSLLKSGMHEHFFENASFKLQVSQGEKLSAWIFIDPDFPPAEVMLQWKSGLGWDHRAYWGQNLIELGTDGTNSRRRIGDIPTGVGWKQLKIPANLVGLEGKLVNGMKFTVHGGRVAWDRVGKLLVSAPEPGPPNPDFVWIDDAPPAGSLLEAVHDTWTNGTWINFNPSPNTGSLSHRHWQNDFNEPYRQRSFSNAPSTMAVNPGDTLFAYVYLYSDPQYRPDTLLLQWLDDSSGWTHRAYWGRDSRDRIAEKVPLPGAGHSTEGWRYMGPIPASGGWVRLEVPASYVGLEGKNVKGMAFGIYQKNNKGRAVWDSAGRTSQPPTVQPVNLKYTTPLWRYKCGSGSGERLYYTPINDHNFLYPDCTGKVNSGYVYGYGAPGTVALHSWQNGQGQWLLNICDTCTFPGWDYRWYVAHTPTATMTDTTPHKNWSCNNNHHYTSYPSPPDSLYPNNCTFVQTMNYSVHTR